MSLTCVCVRGCACIIGAPSSDPYRGGPLEDALRVEDGEPVVLHLHQSLRWHQSR